MQTSTVYPTTLKFLIDWFEQGGSNADETNAYTKQLPYTECLFPSRQDRDQAFSTRNFPCRMTQAVILPSISKSWNQTSYKHSVSTSQHSAFQRINPKISVFLRNIKDDQTNQIWQIFTDVGAIKCLVATSHHTALINFKSKANTQNALGTAQGGGRSMCRMLAAESALAANVLHLLTTFSVSSSVTIWNSATSRATHWGSLDACTTHSHTWCPKREQEAWANGNKRLGPPQWSLLAQPKHCSHCAQHKWGHQKQLSSSSPSLPANQSRWPWNWWASNWQFIPDTKPPNAIRTAIAQEKRIYFRWRGEWWDQSYHFGPKQALLPSGCSISLSPLHTMQTAFFFFGARTKLWTNQLPQLQLLGDSCSKKSTRPGRGSWPPTILQHRSSQKHKGKPNTVDTTMT